MHPGYVTDKLLWGLLYLAVGSIEQTPPAVSPREDSEGKTLLLEKMTIASSLIWGSKGHLWDHLFCRGW